MFRQSLDSRMKEAAAKGTELRKKRVDPVTPDDERTLWEKNVFSIKSVSILTYFDHTCKQTQILKVYIHSSGTKRKGENSFKHLIECILIYFSHIHEHSQNTEWRKYSGGNFCFVSSITLHEYEYDKRRFLYGTILHHIIMIKTQC